MTADALEAGARPPSTAGRALLGVSLLVGFYVLALGVAAALVVFVVASVQAGRFRFGLVGAGLVVVVLVRSIFTLDRAGRGESIGISVEEADEPDLWALVRGVGESTGAPLPRELVIIGDVTAFSARQTRLLGLLAGAPIVGLGLPLLDVLTVDQLRAVVAHELGHLHRHDSRLRAVVYRARVSMERAVDGLAGPLQAVFRAYERFFLRTTMRVARAQEWAADLDAVRLVGGVTQADALMRSATAALTWESYMSTYVVPLFAAGRWPAELVDGFARVLADPARSAELAALRSELATSETHEFDSHPAVLERAAAAIAADPDGRDTADERNARELLRDRERLAARVAEDVGVEATGNAEGGVGWDDVASQVWAPLQAEAAADVLEAAAYVLADERGVPHPTMVESEYDDDEEQERPRAEPEELLEILERGAEDELVRLLAPGFDELDGIDRERVAPGVLQDALFSVLSTALVERRGCVWRFTLSGGPIELVDADGFVVDVEFLATLARTEPERLPVIRDAIAPVKGATR